MRTAVGLTLLATSWSAACTDAGPKGTPFQASFSTPYVETCTNAGTVICTISFTASGTVTIWLESLTGEVTGTAKTDFTESVESVSPPNGCAPQAVGHTQGYTTTVTGTVDDIRFSAERLVPGPVRSHNAVSFMGTLSDAEINGSLTITRTDGPHPSGMTSSASATVAVVLK